MHWENLGPLAKYWPIFVVLFLACGGFFFMERRRKETRMRDHDALAEEYWAREKAYQIALRIREWFSPTSTRRLTYTPSLSDAEIAASIAGDYRADMNEHDFPTRLSRAKFRAWHRGTREADYTIGGFFDRHHPSWGEEDLAWFESLLEEEDADILGWAMATHAPPEKYQGHLMSALQKLDYVAI